MATYVETLKKLIKMRRAAKIYVIPLQIHIVKFQFYIKQIINDFIGAMVRLFSFGKNGMFHSTRLWPR